MKQPRLVLRGHPVWPDGIAPTGLYVAVTGEQITYLGPDSPQTEGEACFLELNGAYICPGFIDLHVHGSGGFDVMDADRDGLVGLARSLAEGGTTAFLATTVSASHEDLLKAINAAADYAAEVGAGGAARFGPAGARLMGLHLEGPFLNPACRGAHSDQFLCLPNLAQFKEYLAAGRGWVKLVTLAPELPGISEILDYGFSRGITFALGHSQAVDEQILQFRERGLVHATHVFNAMKGLHHRVPGTVGAVLDLDWLTVDVIADGRHVHPAVLRLLVKAKGTNKVCLVSDCMRAGGLPDGDYELGGQQVRVREGRACLADGTLAGSTISMADAVRTMVQCAGVSLSDAVLMSAANPARVLGIKGYGLLAPGHPADLTVLDRDLRVVMTLVAGRVVYSAAE